MAEIIATSVAFVLCLGFGRFSEAMVVVGIAALAGLRYRQAAVAAAVGLATTLSLALVVSRPETWAIMLPAGVIYLTRMALGRSRTQPVWTWLVLLPAAILSVRLLNRDVAVCLFAAVAVCVPTLRRKPKDDKWDRRLQLLTAAAVLVAPLVWFLSAPPTRKTAILRGGEWAHTDVKLTMDGPLNIASVYSYSELAEMLNASAIAVESLDDSYGEAWLITPTRPISSESAAAVLSWVKRGGTLIVVTDHTDLFGHARVVNNLVAPTGLRTSFTSFFPNEPSDMAQTTHGNEVWLKTSNVQSGWLLWPFITANWTEESPDYSGRNFFGPMRRSSEDKYGRRTIGGTQSWGLGSITVFGDSTILSNFALYQPGTLPFVERLRHRGMTPLLLLPAYCCLALGWLLAVCLRREFLLVAIPLVGLWSVADWGKSPVTWPKCSWWAGDTLAVMEWSSPERSISTAYALAVLSGSKPRWTDDTKNANGGFWVGTEPPPPGEWRWIKLAQADTAPCICEDCLKPLLEELNPYPPRCWSNDPAFEGVAVGGVWTNSALGDWWFDQGISAAKHHRIKAWVSWLADMKPPPPSEPVKCESADQIYLLKIAGHPPKLLTLPKISLDNAKEVYLGRGVSADVVELDGKRVLYGSKTYIEGWHAPSAWTLVPQ